MSICLTHKRLMGASTNMKHLLSAFVLFLCTTFASGAEMLSPSATSSLLAGVPPFMPSQIEFTKPWRQHRAVMTEEWSRLQPRIASIRQWQQTTLAREEGSCSTMLYPFSGPDFLNAYAFFPACNTYILFGLELRGTVPDLQLMSERQLDVYLSEMRVSLGDLLQRNYFITSHMATQLNTSHFRGVTPIVLAMMASMQLQVISVEQVSIQTANGVKIIFKNPTRPKAQVLYYFSQDATDGPLSKAPEFVAFLSRDKQAHTLIKSASYLLHAHIFSTMQRVVLDSTVFLVQDDTGVPFKKLRGWHVTAHGKYLGPIELFRDYFQADLDAFYRANPSAHPLPFPFGYQWRSQASGLIVARKIP